MFRFTIRELLLLTLSAGLIAGWWLDHRRLNESRVQYAEQARVAVSDNDRLRSLIRVIESDLEERTGDEMTVIHDGKMLTRD